MMDIKLKQALVAARAGHTETAQILLAELIQERPEEADAWFMLSYLVDTAERQARYLQQALALDPGHALAGAHLQRLQEGVPPPVIQSKPRTAAANRGAAAPAAEPATPAPPSRELQLASTGAPAELPEWLQDLDHKQLGAAPTRPQATTAVTAAPSRPSGPPKRQNPVAAAQAPVTEKTIPAPAEPLDSTPVSANQKLLLGVLFVLVMLSVLVLGVLLWQIFL